MATSTTSAFIGKLLAPIGTSEEQADTKQFRAQIARDMMQAWRHGMRSVAVAEAHHRIAAEAFNNSGETSSWGPGPAGLGLTVAYQALVDARRAQCLIPAPTPVQLRWKKRNTNGYGTVPDWVVQAIAADEARFTEGR